MSSYFLRISEFQFVLHILFTNATYGYVALFLLMQQNEFANVMWSIQ